MKPTEDDPIRRTRPLDKSVAGDDPDSTKALLALVGLLIGIPLGCIALAILVSRLFMQWFANGGP